ncbi:MAG: FixH family protein [Kiloniellaceae bacterium]
MSPTRERTLTGRHVLIAVLAFFGVVIAANAVFVVLALDTWTGLSTENAYQRGLAYNETLRAAAAQRALGWRADLSVRATGAGRDRLEVAFTDRRGAPIESLAVTVRLRRPTHEGFDRDVALARAGPGRYAADLELPLRGQWDVRLSARSRYGKRFEFEDRIWLK